MFTRCLCLALCLVSAPAFAVEITTDTIITESPSGIVEFHVRGDSKLTLASSDVGTGYSDVHLYDTSSFELQTGKVLGTIFLHGSSVVEFYGGRLKQRVYALGSGHSTINVFGGTIDGGMNLMNNGIDDVAVVASSKITGTFTIYGDSNTHVNYTVFGNPGYRTNSGITFLSGLAQDEASGSKNIYVRDEVDWLLNVEHDLPGDANRDGVVGIADLNNVRNYFGQTHSNDDARGDTSPYDGLINITDLNRVRNNFGASLTQPVPEPSGVVLTLLTLASMFLLRSRWPSLVWRPT